MLEFFGFLAGYVGAAQQEIALEKHKADMRAARDIAANRARFQECAHARTVRQNADAEDIEWRDVPPPVKQLEAK